MKKVLSLILLLTSVEAAAVTIEFPKDELARESVLPVFENAVAVKSRRVPTAKRFEFGLAAGFAMNEPFFNTTRFGGHLAYHLNETHGILFAAQLYSDGLNSNGETLASTQFNNDTIRMELAPQPENHLLLNYQITPYYGKISIFKDFVMNLSLYGLLGLGTVSIGGEAVPAFNIGMGQKFYFSKRWGIRADLGLLAYEGVNYFAASDGSTTPLEDDATTPGNEALTRDLSINAFERTMNYDLHLSVALIILL
ncbi:MAG: outer membrane beta-barrel domain-containing protein [Bdellovibrionales bacterium]|nr:outer membrane beta-barrel domain-containing protein [Bdellovibrionales bacterium]NQZ19387.1 outer membrane beta-barrel domain-containing protein [Bdellovibrionales bacterium]